MDKDPALAAQILSECLAEGEQAIRFGRTDPRVASTGLFAPKQDSAAAGRGNLRMANALAYITNCVNYWVRGREWRFFRSPVEVLRSMDEVFPATASWARAVAASIPGVAAVDRDQAVAMTWWLADPAEQLPALAAIARTFEDDASQGEKNDGPLQVVLTTMQANVSDLPEYAPEADLKKIPQGPVLRYLDPTVRARFEAALLLSSESDPFHLLPRNEEFWYLNEVQRAESLFNNLLDGVYSGLAPDDFARQMDDVSESYGRFDDLLKDLLEMAAGYALSVKDAERGRTRLGRIANPTIKTAATLLLAQFDDSGGSPTPEEVLKILASAGEIPPMHRANLAAIAVPVCEASGHGTRALLEWGLSQLENADPLSSCHGLSALAAVAPPERRGSMLSQALTSSEQIVNPYLRNDAVANLLGPAVSTADATLVARILERLFDASWTAFMDGLRRAMPQIVNAAGPAIVEKMDAAMRRAQAVSETSQSPDASLDHFDGVLSPALRKQALKSAAEKTAELLLPYLSTFLDQADVVPSLRWVQDSRIAEPDEGDEAFARLHGSRTGLSVWLSDFEHTIWRMVDIRFLFDDPGEAATYHQERLYANSEGKPPISEFAPVGQECHVFGGTDTIVAPGGLNISMTAYYYIFRAGRVVVKLFAAQGQEASEPLGLEHLRPLAERIFEKIVAAGLADESARAMG